MKKTKAKGEAPSGDPLEGAIATAVQFSPEEQAYFYEWLCNHASKARARDVRAWSMEAISRSRSISYGWNRLATHKNTLTALSTVDPRLALELLGGLGAVPIDSGGRRPEDPTE